MFGSITTTVMGKQKAPELIICDNSHNLHYEGACKLVINQVKNLISVKPKDETYKIKTASFKSNVLREKNILFIFGPSNFVKFSIIFKNEKLCKKVTDLINKNNECFDDNDDNEEMLRERFLLTIFKHFASPENSKIKEILQDWILRHDQNEKDRYLSLLKGLEDDSLFKAGKKVLSARDENGGLCRKRKRLSFSFVSENGVATTSAPPAKKKRVKLFHQNPIKYTKITENFKLVYKEKSHSYRCRLLIFTSNDEQEKCYEYIQKKQNIFCCQGCLQIKYRTGASFFQNENGQDYIQIEDKPHQCLPIFYVPENYEDVEILKKFEYEIFNNCSEIVKRLMVIFKPEDQNQCHEYSFNKMNGKFHCYECRKKGAAQCSVARIVHENTENEHVQLIDFGHDCEYQNYQPQKYAQIKEFVLPPNYEIRTKNNNQYLIIFDENNRKLCYIYRYGKNSNYFACVKCLITAKLCKNTEGEEYIILSTSQHLCKPQPYIPDSKELIFQRSQIEFMKNTRFGKPRLFIFTSNSKKLCYVFSPIQHTDNRFACLECKTIERYQGIKGCFKVTLCKESDSNDDDYYVKFDANEKHICQPKKYEPEKFEVETTLQSDDYFLFHTNQQHTNFASLAIFHPDNQKLCYKYCYNSLTNTYFCLPCQKLKNSITAKIHQVSSNGNEVVILNQKKHVCEPLKVSSLNQQKKFVIRKKSGISFEEKKKEKEIIDENKIVVKIPNFEIQKTNFGNQRIVIFKEGSDKELCYYFNYNKCNFICVKCAKNHRITVTAKLGFDDEKNEQYVILGKNQIHECQPVKYEPEKQFAIIKSPSFMIFEDADPKQLVTFTSESKELCYEYSYDKKDKLYRCSGCKTLKAYVSAKIIKSENGEEEYVQLLKNHHICIPKKFILEKFQPKIIPKSDFQLCCNKEGIQNSKVIVFDKEKDGFCYEYFLRSNTKNVYYCSGCKYKNDKLVSVKLLERSNGEKYLQRGLLEHGCDLKKYDPKMLNEIQTISENFVLLHNNSGIPSSRLVVFDPKNKNFGYEFGLQKKHNLFLCSQCQLSKPRQNTYAKLMIDENGKHSIQFTKLTNEHSCKMRNFKEKHRIFESDDFKINESQKTIITKHPTERKMCYKFAYDEVLKVFYCIQCKEKLRQKSGNKLVTATILKDHLNGDKEFLFLNYPHGCKPFKK